MFEKKLYETYKPKVLKISHGKRKEETENILSSDEI